MYKNKEDMLLTLLLDEIFKDTGKTFLNEVGECENFEIVNNILEDENIIDKFYDAILNILTGEIEKYMKSTSFNKNCKIVKLYK